MCASIMCTPELLNLTVSLLVCTQEKFSNFKREESCHQTPTYVWYGNEIMSVWVFVGG